MTPREVLALCREKEIRAVDLRFMDFPGTPKHFTVPVHVLDERGFEEGFSFDASSIRGWQAINKSDMLVIPQPETAFIDPFVDRTLVMICNIKEPDTRLDYAKDPRNVARKAERYLASTGIADVANVGLEPEFFVFDSVRFDQNEHEGFYHVDSSEGQWNRGRRQQRGTPGYAIRFKEGYFPTPPTDTLQGLRNEIIFALEECGVSVEAQHHEVATAGQCEVDLCFQSLLRAADHFQVFKYVARNVAAKHGKTATFMPKPLWNDNGSGLHMHVSLWKDETPLFAGGGYGGLSDTAIHAMGGLLKHTPALMAFCCPTTNSYKRLIPGFDAPVNLTYSYRNRSAAVRIPVHAPRPENKRFEFRCPDSSANPYLSTAAVLMAMIDGIQNRMDPGMPLDKDIYGLDPEELADVPKVPRTLEESLAALREDSDFLLRGDVFTEDVIDTWVWFKSTREAEALRERPHPWEFAMYYDV